MSDDPLDRVRALCLALPEATEKEAWGDVPTFRVRDKIFAQYEANRRGNGRVSLWCKAPSGLQGALVDSAPDRYFVPPYVGRHGWVGVYLDGDPDWEVVADLVDDSYRLTAPTRRNASPARH